MSTSIIVIVIDTTWKGQDGETGIDTCLTKNRRHLAANSLGVAQTFYLVMGYIFRITYDQSSLELSYLSYKNNESKALL